MKATIRILFLVWVVGFWVAVASIFHLVCEAGRAAKLWCYAGLFCVALNLGATEVHVKNFTGQELRFGDSVSRVKLPVGESVFEWDDDATVSVGVADTGMVDITLTDGGITDVLVGLDMTSGEPVYVVGERQGWLAFFAEGFGFGLLVFGYGFTLRIYKNIGKFNPEV